MAEQGNASDLHDIIAQLDEALEVEFTFYNTQDAATAIAALAPRSIAFVLDWVRRVASINTEIGFQFAVKAPQALAELEQTMIEAWLLHAMDTYDRDGLHPAIAVMQDMEGFVHYGNERLAGALLVEHESILTRFVQGLAGRQLKVREAESSLPYTDTETLFLPRMLARFANPADNFRLYKVMAAHLWAQTRFGTWRTDPTDLLAGYANPQRALRCLHLLERVRLDARIAAELPGLYRDSRLLLHLSQEDDDDSSLPLAIRQHLQLASASLDDSLRYLDTIYPQLDPTPLCYQGSLRPDLVAVVRAERIAREQAMLRVTLAEMLEDNPTLQRLQQEGKELTVEPQEDAMHELSMEIKLDGQPLAPPEIVNELVTSIMLDFGEIPEDYLVPAGAGEYDISQYQTQALRPEDVWSGTYHEEGAFLYNEWDYRRKHYKKNWCVLRELPGASGELDFYHQTMHKYRGLLLSVRRTFELLRGEDRLLKRQSEGDDVDIDALVDAWPDFIKGGEMTNRLFTRMRREDRSIAVLFMVDMSGSTRGWINDAEREALILMAEALQVLGDRYAIYGFSGWARKRCEVFGVKTFDEPMTDAVRERLCGIEPKDYTRMGAPIRHLTDKLKEVDARVKLLITLSDGKPDDYDLEYRGQYGIEDTRMALFESRREGVHAYCITIDSQGKDYLPHMYGAASYTVLDDIADLPLKISDIYRKLTS